MDDIDKELDAFMAELHEVANEDDGSLETNTVERNKETHEKMMKDFRGNYNQMFHKIKFKNVFQDIKKHPFLKVLQEMYYAKSKGLFEDVLFEMVVINRKKFIDKVKKTLKECIDCGMVDQAIVAFESLPKQDRRNTVFDSGLTMKYSTVYFLFKAGFKEDAIVISDNLLARALKKEQLHNSSRLISLQRKYSYNRKYEETEFMLDVYHCLASNDNRYIQDYFELSNILRFDKAISDKNFEKAARILSVYKVDSLFYNKCKDEIENKEVFEQVISYFQ